MKILDNKNKLAQPFSKPSLSMVSPNSRFKLSPSVDTFKALHSVRFGSGSPKTDLFQLNAQEINNLETVKATFKAGTDINAVKNKQTILHKFLATPDPNEAVYEFLKAQGMDLSVKSHHGGETALHTLMRFNPSPSLRIIEDLLKHGIDINAKADQGYSALKVFLRTNSKPDTETLRFLLDKGADVNQSTGNAETALHDVMKYPSPSIPAIRLLLSKNVDVDRQDVGGQTALDQYKREYSNQDLTLALLRKVICRKDEKYLDQIKANIRKETKMVFIASGVLGAVAAGSAIGAFFFPPVAFLACATGLLSYACLKDGFRRKKKLQQFERMIIEAGLD